MVISQNHSPKLAWGWERGDLGYFLVIGLWGCDAGWYRIFMSIFTIMASIFCRITREGSLFGGKKNHVIRDLKMTRFAVKISPYFELWF